MFSLTHLPISQVCALCPPPVDTARAHHWDHNCRLLKYREGLSHYERHTQQSEHSVNKENVLVGRLIKVLCLLKVQLIKKKMTQCTGEKVCFSNFMNERFQVSPLKRKPIHPFVVSLNKHCGS